MKPELVKRVADALKRKYPLLFIEESANGSAEAAITAVLGSLQVTQKMVDAFETHLTERHNYCKEFSGCCIIGGLNMALHKMKEEA